LHCDTIYSQTSFLVEWDGWRNYIYLGHFIPGGLGTSAGGIYNYFRLFIHFHKISRRNAPTLSVRFVESDEILGDETFDERKFLPTNIFADKHSTSGILENFCEPTMVFRFGSVTA